MSKIAEVAGHKSDAEYFKVNAASSFPSYQN